MRAVLQRVSHASVTIDGAVVGQIGAGLLVLLGVTHDDDEDAARWLAEKCVHLRIFQDENQKMNRSLLDTNGGMLVVSQFTLHGNCDKGRRPSFIHAAGPDKAIPLYELFIQAVRELGVPVETGRFGAMMQVELVNDGPVTLIVDSPSR